ncbi:uncharacterized protein JCM6883_006461 [Sporobolomyces salmoneus]|uniref:uncharacterized protein n=1 Tax=Sporobolomyces salmoneus TaxID=183962 RepID=UPI0031718AC4
MPSSSTGIERSVSPSPRSRSLPLSSNQPLVAGSGGGGVHDTRYRQQNSNHLQQPHPDLGYHQNGYSVNGNGYLHSAATIPGGAGGNGGMLNGNSSTSRSPFSHSHSHEQGTLSTLITQVYRSALSTFSSSSSSSASNQPFLNVSSSSSSSSLLHKLRPQPSSSTTSTPSTTTNRFVIPSASTVGFVLLCCLWYLSSALSSNTGKSILTRFRYPVTLTFVQFAFVAAYSLVVLAVRNRFSHSHSKSGGGGGGSLSSNGGRRRSSFGAAAAAVSMNTLQGWGVRKPTKNMFNGTLMMSLFQIAGHVFSSMAIARVPVSTVHTIKALSPLFTVLSYVALFGVRYSTPTYISLFPLTIGVMLACSFDLRANAIGFLCALGSTFIFVAQNIFSKKLLPKESTTGGGGGDEKSTSGGGGGSHAKLDKMNLLFYSSGMAFFLMIPIWLYSDASSLFFSPPSTSTLTSAPENTTASLLFYFFLNGTVHFGQNLLAFSLLARTSPVTYSIASLVKRIAVICIAIVWFGQPVKPIQGFGMSLTFGGLYLYNQSKGSVEKGEKKRRMVEKKRGGELPMNREDARLMMMDEATDSGNEKELMNEKKQEMITRRSLENQAFNPYQQQNHLPPPHPPPHSSSSAQPSPLPPHASGASTHEHGQISRNRQTSLPLAPPNNNNPYSVPPPSSASNPPLPPSHQLSQQFATPHAVNHLQGGGGGIQVGYR